jgi:hypothetical protein
MDPAEAAACIRWARECWEAMQPFSTGGVYVNYLSAATTPPTSSYVSWLM